MRQDDRETPSAEPAGYVGILLAAGKGRRFDPAGARNKLLQTLPGGASVVGQAARNLRAATASLLAVVPADDPALAAHLAALGIATSVCADAGSGMAASLIHGIRQTRGAAGWLIALGDMPFVRPDTMRRLLAALAQGADIVAPSYGGARGNPVGFSRLHLEALLQLSGDAGARDLLRRHPVAELAVDDPGVCRDIDTPGDLAPAAG